MKNYKQILEAINRGIQFALDDFDSEDIELSKPKQQTITKDDSLYKAVQLREYTVDLGLPSGTLWCKHYMGIEYIESPSGKLVKKVDSTADNNCINYYAWGETEPNKDIQDNTKFDWDNYKFLRGQTMTKYSSDWDNLTQLKDEDDVAYQKFHIYNFKFHIPTKEQFEELLKYTTYKYIDKYTSDHKHEWGGEFISIINGKSIFFPFASAKTNSDSAFMGGYLWSSTTYNDRCAWYLSFGSNFCRLDSIQKCDGLPICPVYNP